MTTSPEAPRIGRWEFALAFAGLALCVLGYILTYRDPHTVRTVLASASGCNMPTDIYEPRSGTPAGSVVLFHGLSANKKVMMFTAQEFSNLDLRVYVPDLPGHGKAPGPFSPARAEFCAGALVRSLTARRAILPERTILAGHSMGGALAVRVGAQIPVAATIAISPAPMQATSQVATELLLFPTHPPLPAHSLVLSASAEPAAIREIARELVGDSPGSSSKYEIIPNSSHVSILFSTATFEALRAWSAQILGTRSDAPLPGSRPATGSLLGILGLCLIVPPFLREIAPGKSTGESAVGTVGVLHAVATVTLFSVVSVIVFRFFVPFTFVRLFQGGYFVSLLFSVGAAILVVWHRSVLASFRDVARSSFAASLAGILLVLLFGAWFELTFHEAWLTPARWLRLPLLFVLLLPWHWSEELLLGDPQRSPSPRRVSLALAFRSIVWLVATLAIFYLHSGQFVFVLLPGYFFLFSILQRLAMDAIRHRTRSLPAAAIFGAILLAGFVLAILPVA